MAAMVKSRYRLLGAIAIGYMCFAESAVTKVAGAANPRASRMMLPGAVYNEVWQGKTALEVYNSSIGVLYRRISQPNRSEIDFYFYLRTITALLKRRRLFPYEYTDLVLGQDPVHPERKILESIADEGSNLCNFELVNLLEALIDQNQSRIVGEILLTYKLKTGHPIWTAFCGNSFQKKVIQKLPEELRQHFQMSLMPNDD